MLNLLAIAGRDFRSVDEASIKNIIERLQLCIVDAKALQLSMLERLLSMALMQAHQDRDESSNGRG